MTGIATILCPIDFSPVTPAVVQYAIALAAPHNASVTLLHVTRPMHRFAALDVSPEALDDFTAVLHHAAMDKMRRFKESSLAGVDVEARVELGYPPETIVNVAKDIHADIIIMSTHGYSGLKHMVFGSVAEKVVKTSPVPVLTLRPEALQHE